MSTHATVSKPVQTQNRVNPQKPKTTGATTKPSTPGKAQQSKQSEKQYTLDKWISMSRAELDEIYKKAKPGALPQGVTRGTAILGGGLMPRLFARAARAIAWQGKVFDVYSPDCNSGVVVNKILPIGLNMIVAKTYRGESWMDGKDTIIIDYSDTSLFARQIRDEIREVEPGLYLGKVWWGKTRVLDFALETHDKHHAAASKSGTRKSSVKKR
jgi:hypothetical protein